MTTTHEAGPLVVFGQSPGGPTPDYNPDQGTSLFYAGSGLLDQRGYWAYNPGYLNYQGWLGSTEIFAINFTPNALSTSNLASVVVPVNGTALVLTGGAGTTSAASVLPAAGGAAVGSLLLLDGLTASVVGSITANILSVASVNNGNLTVGSVLASSGGTSNVQLNTTIIGMGGIGGTTGEGGTGTYLVTPTPNVTAQVTITAVAGINGVPIIPGQPTMITGVQQATLLGTSGSKTYNPQAMLGRNIRLTTQSGDTAVYTVRGFDIYGFAMSESITAAGAGTVSGKKAFKYVQSVTPVGTVGAFASVGTGDVYGFPLFSLSFQDVYIQWGTTGNSGLITATTGYLAGVLTNPATSTTGDIRGTYAVQSASGTNQLVVWQSPQPTQIISTPGTYGVTQA